MSVPSWPTPAAQVFCGKLAACDPLRKVLNRNMKIGSSSKYLVAVGVGAVYSWFAVAFWERYVVISPINDWLLEVFAKQGHNFLYYISIYAHDIFLNILLATPAAIALFMIKGSNNWACVMVAAAAAVIVSYWGMELASLPTLIHFWGFWAGLGMASLSLPIAFATVRAVRKQPILA